MASGTTGADVKQLQKYLNHLGFRGAVDGQYGPETRKRVLRLERQEGLGKDGRVVRKEARYVRDIARAARKQQASAKRQSAASESGGSLPESSTTPGGKARLSSDGRTAIAPADAPDAVKEAIAAANEITDKPYRYGGGHGSFEDSGYDCSGAVSYALHGGGLLKRPLDSSSFMSWGDRGKGSWITVYANEGHAYVLIAGLRFDTAGGKGPRWHKDGRSSRGYRAVHPPRF